MATFFETITAAINDAIEHGYESEARLEWWVEQIRQAAAADMVPEAVLEQHLKGLLTTTWQRLIDKGSILKQHPGVDKFTLERIRPALRAELDRRILASAKLIKLNRQQTITETLQRFQGWMTSIPTGGTDAKVDKNSVKAGMRKELASLPFRERRVLIDQGHKLNASLSDIIAEDQGAIAAEWHSNWRQMNYDYRPEHKHRDGVVYATKKNWAIRRRFMTPSAGGYYEDHERPGEFVYCLPGDARIPFADLVEVAYRHWYSGQLTTLITDTGKTLRATPNHPVLTPHGWRPADAMQEGDYIIEVAEQSIHLAEPHQNDGPPPIAEIFSALHELGVRERRRGSHEQFHGDGAEGEVDIVRADRPLRIDLITGAGQRDFDLTLTEAPNTPTGVSASGGLAVGSLGAPPGLMSRLSETLPTLDALAPHADHVRLATPAQADAALEKHLAEIPSGYAEALGQGQQAFPFAVRTSRIVGVKREDFSGHVFNLQTSTGWYVAQGIVTHNCRCYVRWLYNLRDLPKDMLTDKGREALKQARKALAGE